MSWSIRQLAEHETHSWARMMSFREFLLLNSWSIVIGNSAIWSQCKGRFQTKKRLLYVQSIQSIQSMGVSIWLISRKISRNQFSLCSFPTNVTKYQDVSHKFSNSPSNFHHLQAPNPPQPSPSGLHSVRTETAGVFSARRHVNPQDLVVLRGVRPQGIQDHAILPRRPGRWGSNMKKGSKSTKNQELNRLIKGKFVISWFMIFVASDLQFESASK